MRPKPTMSPPTCQRCGMAVQRRPDRSTRFCSRRCYTGASVEERFWSKVLILSDLFSCWEWIGGRDDRNRQGYGKFSLRGRLTGAHRVAFELCYGAIPEGLQVLHHCDNRPCVRPEHLFLGTPKDNTDDMWAKGRGVTPTIIQRSA